MAEEFEEFFGQSREAANVAEFFGEGRFVTYEAAAASQRTTTYFDPVEAARAYTDAAVLPVVEFSDEAEQVTADYSPPLEDHSHTQG